MTKARDQSGQEGCCGELYNPNASRGGIAGGRGGGGGRSSARVDFCLDGGSEERKFKVWLKRACRSARIDRVRWAVWISLP